MTRARSSVQITRSENSYVHRVLMVGTTFRPQWAAGYEVQVIEEGERWQEIKTVASNSDCIVLALGQFAENLQLCQQLRLQPETSELPIVIGVTSHTEATAAIQAGASEFCLVTNAKEELSIRLQLCLLNHQHAQRIAWQLDEQQREITISHLLMDKVVDALPVSLYVVDRDLRIVAWNRNREIGEQGIERQHVIGRHVLEVFSKMPRYRLEREFMQVFATGELLRFEQESTAEGNTRHWLISKVPMCLGEDSNEVTHVITVGEEITEQKKMNGAILHAAKLAGIGRLASGVVHEINNPLATIAACTEALQNRLEEASSLAEETRTDFREYLKLVSDETFRCKMITNSLLEFSRNREAEKTPHDLNYLIEQTLRLVKHHPKLKQLPLQTEWGENLPKINANEGQMKQVFLALITNACDAVEESTGTLSIRTNIFNMNGAEFIGVDFTDNGVGIVPEMQAKIFEPFVTTKPFGQGTGLGLAVCYGIISDHSGKIEVISQVGQGTTMRVLLPIPRGVEGEDLGVGI